MWCLLAACIVSLVALTECSAPEVTCPWGHVQGVVLEGRGGRKMGAYLGIPYALPPTGPLRWQKPRPHPGPEEGEVYIADTLKPACPQETGAGVYAGTSEDCLTLNVYVPLNQPSVASPKAVMVWIHGGALFIGEAAAYRPTKLVADGDVIVVSIQYRLGALGFLSTGDVTLPGNLGLWDQNLALHWVKDNIRAFGGDPDRVTLFGNSAGSWSTGLQMLSPHSKGLFQRAILQSGSPFSPTVVAPEAKVAFKGLARLLDCEASTAEDSLACLKTRPADDIVRHTPFLRHDFTIKSRSDITPCSARVDGDFLPRDPVDLAHDARYVQEQGVPAVDVMVGLNNKEGAMVMHVTAFAGHGLEGLNDPALFDSVLDLGVKMANRRRDNKLLKAVMDFFYRGADFNSSEPVAVETLVQLYGDALFYAHTFQWLRALAKQTGAGRRYVYFLEQDHSFNKNSPAPGSHHTDEFALEFEMVGGKDMFFFNKTRITPEEEKLSDLFVQMVAEFAKTGNPNPALKGWLDADWPQFTSEDEAVLSLTVSPSVKRDIMRERIAFWTQLVPHVIEATQPQSETPPDKTPNKDEL